MYDYRQRDRMIDRQKDRQTNRHTFTHKHFHGYTHIDTIPYNYKEVIAFQGDSIRLLQYIFPKMQWLLLSRQFIRQLNQNNIHFIYKSILQSNRMFVCLFEAYLHILVYMHSNLYSTTGYLVLFLQIPCDYLFTWCFLLILGLLISRFHNLNLNKKKIQVFELNYQLNQLSC